MNSKTPDAAPAADAPRGMAGNVVSFSRFLKEAGLPTHPRAVVDACRSVAAVDIGDPRQVYCALRANFITRHEQIPDFDKLYALFWEEGVRDLYPQHREVPLRPQAGTGNSQGKSPVDVILPDRPASGGASSLEVLQKKDLRHLSPEEHPLVREALHTCGLLEAKRQAT